MQLFFLPCDVQTVSQANSAPQVALNLVDSAGGGERVANEVGKLIFLALIKDSLA